MQQPFLSKVILSRDVAWSCLSHSLTTEYQEIMGLLLGYVSNTELFITRSLVLARKDRQKDRVEVGDELVALSATVAEKICAIDGREESVIGWYHSHPHITVMPSHVDVKTQGNYQQLDSAFVGLIFSVFDSGRFDICAFQANKQSIGQDWTRSEIPIVLEHKLLSPFISTSALDSVAALQLVTLNEELEVLIAHRSLDGDSLPSSSLRQCRLTNTYQSALYRLMDQQLLPTLLSLQSRRRSLEMKLSKLRIGKSQQEPSSCGTGQSSNKSGSVDGESILSVLGTLAPEWVTRSACIELVFAGIFVRSVRIESSFLVADLDPLAVYSTFQLEIIPSPPLICPSVTQPLSPWCIRLKPVSVGPNEVVSQCSAPASLRGLFWLLAVSSDGQSPEQCSCDATNGDSASHLALDIWPHRDDMDDAIFPSPSESVRQRMSIHMNIIGRADGKSPMPCTNRAEEIATLLRRFLHMSLQLDVFNFE